MGFETEIRAANARAMQVMGECANTGVAISVRSRLRECAMARFRMREADLLPHHLETDAMADLFNQHRTDLPDEQIRSLMTRLRAHALQNAADPAKSALSSYRLNRKRQPVMDQRGLSHDQMLILPTSMQRKLAQAQSTVDTRGATGPRATAIVGSKYYTKLFEKIRAGEDLGRDVSRDDNWTEEPNGPTPEEMQVLRETAYQRARFLRDNTKVRVAVSDSPNYYKKKVTIRFEVTKWRLVKLLSMREAGIAVRAPLTDSEAKAVEMNDVDFASEVLSCQQLASHTFALSNGGNPIYGYQNGRRVYYYIHLPHRAVNAHKGETLQTIWGGKTVDAALAFAASIGAVRAMGANIIVLLSDRRGVGPH